MRTSSFFKSIKRKGVKRSFCFGDILEYHITILQNGDKRITSLDYDIDALFAVVAMKRSLVSHLNGAFPSKMFTAAIMLKIERKLVFNILINITVNTG